jgi:hypothetical protein
MVDMKPKIPMPKGPAGIIGKVVSNAVGSRIGTAMNGAGPLGAVAGMVATRLVKRSPVGAVIVGGAWVVHKLYLRKKERDEEAAAHSAKPVKAAAPEKPTPRK